MVAFNQISAFWSQISYFTTRNMMNMKDFEEERGMKEKRNSWGLLLTALVSTLTIIVLYVHCMDLDCDFGRKERIREVR